MRRFFRFICRSLMAMVCCYVAVCVVMWFTQRDFLYAPTHDILPLKAYNLSHFKAISLHIADSLSIQAWYKSAEKNRPVILYFHGNSGHLGHRADYFNRLSDAGFGVFAIDYRGYGKSEGQPSEQGFYEDARAAIRYVLDDLAIPLEQVILYGESIGTGVAIQMASEFPVAGLILQSPYTSITAVAQTQFWWLPVGLLLTDRFESIEKIHMIQTPLLLFHGKRDALIAYHHSEALLLKANEPKHAIYFPEVGHNGFPLDALVQAMVAFSRRHRLIAVEDQDTLPQIEAQPVH